MTLVRAETGEIVAEALDENEARALTAKIKSCAGMTWQLLLEAHEGRAWLALGYGTWAEYVRAEFDIAKSYAYRLIAKAEIVAELAEANQSPIGDIPESHARELKPVPKGERAPVYREARQKAEAEGRPVTASDLHEAAQAKRERADRLDETAERNAEKADDERDQADLLAAAAERVDASAVGYRARWSRVAARISEDILTNYGFQPERIAEVTTDRDDRRSLHSFADGLRDFADRVDAALNHSDRLRLVEDR